MPWPTIINRVGKVGPWIDYKTLKIMISRSGLGAVRWSENRLHSALVNLILLGETIPAISMFYVYMVPILTDVCYKYK